MLRKFLERWFTFRPEWPDQRIQVRDLMDDVWRLKREIDRLEDLKPATAPEMTTELLRRSLGISPIEVPPEVREKLVGMIGPSTDILENLFDNLIKVQERDISVKATDWYQVVFGRGTINGYELAKEEMEKIASEWRHSRNVPDPVKRTDILPS